MNNRTDSGMIMKYLTAAFLAAILSVSCSSLPKDEKQTPASEVKNLAAAHAASGNSYYIKGNYEMAQNFFIMSRDLNLSVDNRKGLAESYNSLGKLYLAWGRKEAAVENFKRARTIADELHLPELSAQCLAHRGEMALMDGDIQQALDFFEEGLLLVNPKDHPIVTAVLYHNLAGAYKKQEEYEKAVESVMIAINLNEKADQYSELGANHYLLSSLYSKQGNFDLALENSEKALENDKLVENSLGIGQDLNALGMISIKKEDYENAHEYFLRAFLVYESMGIIPKMKQVLIQLLEVSQKLGLEEETELYRITGEKLEAME